MNWNLNCRKTRRLLALAAGNDLDERELAGAERHLAVCPQCRQVWQGLQQTQQALEQVRAAPMAESNLPAPSLWPAVARHVRTIDAQAATADWRGWLPAGALAAACLAVVMVALPDLPSASSTAHYGDPRVIVPQQFVIQSDPETLQRLPITNYSDRDGAGGQDSGPQPLRLRDEPRSF
jgi:hypothetical protein